MNSAVEPIFNESFDEKKKFVGPVNSTRDPLELSFNAETCFQKNKKKRKMPDAQDFIHIQTDTISEKI